MSTKVIIIGASSGIGEALAKEFSGHGFVVGMTARRTELLEKIQKQLSTKSYIKYMDLFKPEDAVSVFNGLVNEMGGVDIVVINSGVGRGGETLLWDDERAVIDVNVTGFTAIAVAATKYFIERKKGHIVGISSIAAIRAHGIDPAYCASKSFVSAYLRGLRHKFARQGFKDIYVTEIRPGFVKTPMTEDHPMFWAATPEKAAQQIYSTVIKKRQHAYITKRWTLIAWGLRIVPDFIYNRL